MAMDAADVVASHRFTGIFIDAKLRNMTFQRGGASDPSRAEALPDSVPPGWVVHRRGGGDGTRTHGPLLAKQVL